MSKKDFKKQIMTYGQKDMVSDMLWTKIDIKKKKKG